MTSVIKKRSKKANEFNRFNWVKVIGILFVILGSVYVYALTFSQEGTSIDTSSMDTQADIDGSIPQVSNEEFDTGFDTNGSRFQTATTLYDQADTFFSENKVHEMYLEFDNEDWYEELYVGHANDADDPYFPVTIKYENDSYGQIGINFKGHSSFMDNNYKKSFRLDFNYYDSETDFFGLKKLNLNNGFMDPTMMREKIFWDFASNYVEVVRCSYTKLFINGEYFGLFTVVEHIDDEFVESRYGSQEKGNLYRAESQGTLEYLGDEDELYSTNYELKTNENAPDYGGLIQLTDILTNTPTEDLEEKLESILDVENTLYCMALLNLFGSLDSYLGSAHNFYLYQSEETGLFTHILWDANMAFGTFEFGLAEGEEIATLDPFWTPTGTSMAEPRVASNDTINASISTKTTATSTALTTSVISNEKELDAMPSPPPGEGPPNGDLPQVPGGEFASLSTNRPLFERLLEVDAYRQTYLRILAQMIREGFNTEVMQEEIDVLSDLIRSDLRTDPNKLYSMTDFELGLTEGLTAQRSIYGLLAFVEERSIYLTKKLNAYTSSEDLCINEILEPNYNGSLSIRDEAGDEDPWIELYNRGPGDLNLSNYYLTDSPTTPTQWSCGPAVIEDGDYFLIWTDGESEDGDNHTSFSINLQEGNLYLYYYNASRAENIPILIDSYQYQSLGVDGTIGRYPDGGNMGYQFVDFPSPNSSNCLNRLEVKIPTTLVLNEFMAKNTQTLADPTDSSGFPDWIELYNFGSEDLDLSGMYLTDNLLDPTLWQFPENSSIASQSYLIIWADGNSDQGEYHTNFKLSADGEEIGLIANDGRTILDSIVYSAVIQDFSMGRFPDGLGDWIKQLATPTPGEDNQNLEKDTATVLETTSFFVFLGGLFAIAVMSNRLQKRSRNRDNGQFWIAPVFLPQDGIQIQSHEENIGES